MTNTGADKALFNGAQVRISRGQNPDPYMPEGTAKDVMP